MFCKSGPRSIRSAVSCRVTDVRTVHVGGSFAVGSTTPGLVSAGPTTRPTASQRRRDAQRGEHQYRAGRDRDAEAEDYDEQRILPCSNFTRPAAAAAAALSVLHRRQFVVLAARRRATLYISPFHFSSFFSFFLSFTFGDNDDNGDVADQTPGRNAAA